MIDKEFFQLCVKKNDKTGFAEKPGVPDISRFSPIMGRAFCAGPETAEKVGSNQFAVLDYTGPPGSATGIYFSLLSFFSNNGFKTRKVNEWISVTPEHQQYYNMVVEQKRQLEGVIKTGLASASQAVADASLVEHDLRKYKEILDYFKEGVGKGEKKGNEHSLRAMFIDQVDVHTGDGISLRSVVQRWPTIIADFMKLSSGEDSIEKVENALKGISKAEAVILTTKNKLFIEWEKMFKDTAADRYNSLKSLVASRKKTVEEYRDWIKPYLARFKSMKLGHENIGGVLESAKTPYELAGQASFANGITIWAWKNFMPSEFRKPSVESIYKVPIADKFAVDHFIKDEKVGLACNSFYPQLRNKLKDPKTGEELEATVADKMIEDIVKKEWTKENGLDPDSLYYILFIIDINRTGGKMPGYEFEGAEFNVKTFLVSQNVMLVKMLELKLREQEIENYFDQILGISDKDAFKSDYPELAEKKEEKKDSAIKIDLGLGKYAESAGSFFRGMDAFFAAIGNGAKRLSSGLNLPLLFAKPGPYVRDFADTATAFFMGQSGPDYFGPVKSFIMDQMKIG